MKTWPMSVDRPMGVDRPSWCSAPSHVPSVGVGSSKSMLRTVTERSDPSPCAACASRSMLWVIRVFDNKEVTLVVDM